MKASSDKRGPRSAAGSAAVGLNPASPCQDPGVRRNSLWLRLARRLAAPAGMPAGVPDSGTRTGGTARDVPAGGGSGLGPATDPHEAEANTVAVRALGGPSDESTLRREVGDFLGYDFSGVRLHREVAGLAGEGAAAETRGAEVSVAPGRYRPDLPLGRALIAHELTHVAQQGAAPRRFGPGAYRAELEAFRASHPSGRLQARAAGLSDPAPGLTPAPRGMRQRTIEGCGSGGCSRGPAPTPRERFRSNNSQLAPAQLDKIERAVGLAARGNPLLEERFYQYYSGHEIRIASARELAQWRPGLYAETQPNSDTIVRPTLLDATTTDERLAGLLMHEFSHTRHHTNFMGTRDYEEGDSYAIEFFMAERTGDTARATDIRTLVGTNASSLAMACLEELPDATAPGAAGGREALAAFADGLMVGWEHLLERPVSVATSTTPT